MNAETVLQTESEIQDALVRHDYDRAQTLSNHYLSQANKLDEYSDVARTPWFRSRCFAAQVALDAGVIEKALAHLDPLLSFITKLPAPLACRLLLYAAEALTRTNRTSEARNYLQRSQAFPEVLATNPLLKLRELRIRLWLGELPSLGSELTTGIQSLHNHPEQQAQLLIEEGRAWDAAGDLARADNCWSRAREILPQSLPGQIRADLLIQQGRVAHLRGKLQIAIDRFNEALAAIRSNQCPQVAEIKLRRILVRLELNQWESANNSWDELCFEQGGHSWPIELRPLVSLVECLLHGKTDAESAELQGYLVWQRGDLALARSLYERTYKSEKNPVRRARIAFELADLTWTDQKTSIDPSGIEAVDTWLKTAEELAKQEDLDEVLWRVHALRGQIAAERDRDEAEARHRFEQAVLISEQQRRRLRNPTDAAAYHLHRLTLTQQLYSAACGRGDIEKAFHYQELNRGRLLVDLAQAAGKSRLNPEKHSELGALEKQVQACEAELQLDGPPSEAEMLWRRRDELLQRRNRLLEAVLADCGRGSEVALPTLPTLAELASRLPEDAVYVAPGLVNTSLNFLIVRHGETPSLKALQANDVGEGIRDFQILVQDQIDRYRHGFLLGSEQKQQLDCQLDRLGSGPLGQGLNDLLRPGERVYWAPDDSFHGLPLAALRIRGRYLVELHDIIHVFSGAHLVHQTRTRPRRRRGLPLLVTESPNILPGAENEGRMVEAGLGRVSWFRGSSAERRAIRPWLRQAKIAHFACHAVFDPNHPLAAHLCLPSGETWHGIEWLDEPVNDLPLVTLSACRSAQVQTVVGKEVFGLVTALLASGVRAVLAGLWSVPDKETAAFMGRFYSYLLTCDLSGALARTQRDCLAQADSSPLFWAVFSLFGEPTAISVPPWWRFWWGQWKQGRLRRRFGWTNPTEPRP